MTADRLSRRKKAHVVERVGTRVCPHCNAEARLVVERDKPTSTGWEMYVVCDRCKSRTFIGLISNAYKKRIDRNYALMKKWDKAKTPAERGRIMRAVQALAKEEEEWEKSL